MIVGHADVIEEPPTRRTVEMNGIIQEENRLRGSNSHERRHAALSSLTQTREGRENSPRQIFAETIRVQNDFADEREYAHWGINE
jgi:oligoendopeptidase F